ncbi:unnamed protein product, partial [Musa acuminata subsp. burmannicoides]
VLLHRSCPNRRGEREEEGRNRWSSEEIAGHRSPYHRQDRGSDVIAHRLRRSAGISLLLSLGFPESWIAPMEVIIVVGFEVPRSPDSSYNNPIPGNEDEAREPPLVPPHLHHTLLNYPHGQDDPSSLSMPQNVILNHLYIGNQDGPRSVVALGITHRVRSKYVTVVLYKPVQRR